MPEYCPDCGEPLPDTWPFNIGQPWRCEPCDANLWQADESAASGMYPPGWPRCIGCGEPALDGHATCGRARCSYWEMT